MKFFFHFIFFLPFFSSSQAEIWPTTKAEWYYTFTDQQYFNGYSSYKIERDTLIGNDICQIYSRKSEQNFSGLPFDQYHSSFIDKKFIVLVKDSVVFSFDETVSRYDTIMDFKAEIGINWRNYTNDDLCLQGFEYILTTVLDKEIETINGLNLLKFKLERKIVPGNENGYIDYYYQLFGSNFDRFIPNICSISDYTHEKDLRCFFKDNGEQNEFVYKPFLGECDEYPEIVSLEDVNLTNEISVCPNPIVNGKIYFENKTDLRINSISIYELSGKQVKNIPILEDGNKLIISTNHLNSGIYFYSIHTEINAINGKFLVQTKD